MQQYKALVVIVFAVILGKIAGPLNKDPSKEERLHGIIMYIRLNDWTQNMLTINRMTAT
jgi:hypothetical protein